MKKNYYNYDMKTIVPSRIISSLFAVCTVCALSVSGAFAQGVFEGSGEEDDSNCVGDGCGFVSPSQTTSSEYGYSQDGGANGENASENPQDGSEVASGDSARAADTVTVATKNIDEEDDDRPHYVESAEEYRARKEGFSKGIQFGIRLAGGPSKNFGKKSEDWNLGYSATGGLMAKLPLSESFAMAMELDFSYRHYSYEGETSYSSNEATIDEMLFEIPLMGQVVFDEDGLYMGLGVNLGLKMKSDSEFEQTVVEDGKKKTSKNSNTLPTEFVELGGLFDIGYVVNRWIVVDLRFVQNFTNMLDLDLIAESPIMHSKLYTMHASLGVTILL